MVIKNIYPFENEKAIWQVPDGFPCFMVLTETSPFLRVQGNSRESDAANYLRAL